MQINLGFSTCPNDTFMFDAMVNHKIDTKGFTFNRTMADIKDLNQKAFDGILDLTKLSYHAYAYLRDEYILLDSGSALGHNCGPLLISKNKMEPQDLVGKSVAIPGKYTTANLLFSIAYPHLVDKKIMLFYEIENAVLSGKVDLGLIIHENRFTYQEKGLHKVMDLGSYWEDSYHYPIPLGGIAAKRSLGQEKIKALSQILSESVQYAFDHPTESEKFVLEHAQEMELDVVKQHIDLYVNQYSISLGDKGREAVKKLYQVGADKGLFTRYDNSIFVS